MSNSLLRQYTILNKNRTIDFFSIM